MKKIKNFLLLGLMPFMVLALAVGCGEDPIPDDPDDGPVGPNVTKDSVINLQKSELSVGLAGGSAIMGYTITNPHADAKISAETSAEWISEFDVSTPELIRFNVAANDAKEGREALVTVKYLYAENVTFLVKQGAKSNATFSLENVDVTSDYFSYTVDVIPSDKTIPYIVMSASPSYIEAYELEEDEALFADDYSYFEYLGQFHGMSAIEIMNVRAKVGDARRVTVGGAVPGDTYIFYAYYFDPVSGTLLSDIARFEIVAGHPELGEADFTFQYDIQGPDVATQVDPVGYSGDYYFDVMTGEEIRAAAQEGFTPEQYFVRWWAYVVAGLVNEGYSTSDILAQNTCVGEGRNKWNYELMANQDYYIFAFALEENSLCCTTPKYEVFTTGDAVMSSNVITPLVTDITSVAAKFHFTTTVADDPYAYSWATAEEWASYGSTDEARVKHLLDNYVFEVFRGDMTQYVSDLTPDTDYVLYTFGIHGGVATTPVYTKTFKTVSDAPGVASISFKDLGYYDSADLIYYPGWGWLDSANYSGVAIFPIELDIQPANHGAYFYEIYDWTDRYDEYNDEQYRDGLIWQIGDKGSMTQKYSYTILKFDGRYVAVAIVVDANGQYSELYKKEIICTYDGVESDPNKLVEWWDAMQSGSGSISSVYNAKPMVSKPKAGNVKMSEREIVRENQPVKADEIPATRY